MYTDAKAIKRLAHRLPDERIVVFDTETTGLSTDDEVLQVSAVDGAGRLLLNEYIRPMRKTSWEGAYEIHGISPRDVEHAPTLKQIKTKLDKIFSSASLIIVYNIEFDDRMLRQSGYSIRDVAPQTPCIDVMLDYAAMVRQSYGNEYKWQPLQGCAAHYGVDFEAHDSAQDAKATAKCFKCMTYDAEYQLHAVIPQVISEIKKKKPSPHEDIPHVRTYVKERGKPHERISNMALRFASTRAFKKAMAAYPKIDGRTIRTTALIRAWESGCAIITDENYVIAKFDKDTEEFQSLKDWDGQAVEINGWEVHHGTVARLHLKFLQ